MNVQPILPCYRDQVNAILKREWDCPPSISRGKIMDTTILTGFLYMEDNVIQGVLTYHIKHAACEVITLNSLKENCGIGTALIHAILEEGKGKGCHRIWLITTNTLSQLKHRKIEAVI